MYGYVVANKDELKIKDFNRYRSFYCGLCHSLKENYSFAGQLSVNYDMTFLTVLLSALYTPPTKKKKARCVVHPVMKQEYLSSEVIDYTADMNVLLAYCKCVDDWKDEQKILRYLYAKVLGSKSRGLKRKYSNKIKRIRLEILELTRKENLEDVELDELAGHFGRVMSEIFAYREDEWEEDLRKVGFLLGKYIYILDAFDDYERDIEKGMFNALELVSKRLGKEALAGWVRGVLELIAADCARAFEMLPIIEHVDILRNILYSGIWSAYEKKNRGN